MANKENVVTALILMGKNNYVLIYQRVFLVVTALILMGKNNF